MSSRTRTYSSLEPLEARIAPALLVVGANLLGGSNPHTGETSIGGQSVTLVKVLSGEAIVWYGAVAGGGLGITEISVGPNVKLDITGNVFGDIVANLTASGHLTDSDNNPANGQDGNVLLPNNILGITTHQLATETGNIGHIITGGSVSNINVNGELDGIYAGNGAFRALSSVQVTGSVTSNAGVLVNPADPHSTTDFTFTAAHSTFLPGASITNVTVAVANEMQVFAGDGAPTGAAATGAGKAGGNVSHINISASVVNAGAVVATPSYYLLGGDGGAGTSSGGAGGSVFDIKEETSSSLVQISGGNGGNASTGKGGAGGGVHDLDMAGSSASYTITGGNGGKGLHGGGAGGSLVHNSFASQTPNTGIILSADFTGDGLDDVLVADGNTGNMILEQATAGGTSFVPFTQYTDMQTGPVVLIPGSGTTPSAAFAIDVNGDNQLDLVVAYKNSNSVVVYLNQGGTLNHDGSMMPEGSFFAQQDDNSFKPVISKNNTSIAPEEIVPAHLLGGGGLGFVVASGTSAEYLANDSGKLTAGNPVTIPSSVTALASAQGVVYAGTLSGNIYTLSLSLTEQNGLTVDSTVAGRITGGVADLAVDSTTELVAAVSKTGKLITVFQIGNNDTLTAGQNLNLTAQTGRSILAEFLPDTSGTNQPDSLIVLSVTGTGSEFGLYTPNAATGTGTGTGTTMGQTYTFSHELNVTGVLTNFDITIDTTKNAQMVPVPTSYGVAALGGSLDQFVFSFELNSSTDFTLPFSGKKVIEIAGNGGDSTGSGPGGAGGDILGINIVSTDISLTSGTGGGSVTGHAGNGGSIANTGKFTLFDSTSVTPTLSAQEGLSVKAGAGGLIDTTGAVGSAAIGGNGGSISGLTATLMSGDIFFTAGDGSAGHGGAGGNGGSLGGLTITNSGNFTAVAGAGGDAPQGTAKAGAGGSVTGLNYSLTLDAEQESTEVAYGAAVSAGHGGASLGGAGGAGGSISTTTLTLDPPNTTDFQGTSDTMSDSTVRASLQAGFGGQGATGGTGGSLSKIVSTTVFDQTTQNTVTLNAVVLDLVAGFGGRGTAGNGGNGGSINLKGSKPIEGITDYDKDAPESGDSPLVVTAGRGGDGSVKGGVGGSISGLQVVNAIVQPNFAIDGTELEGATVTAGTGGQGGSGAGGAGGSISSVSLGTDGLSLIMQAGSGGAGSVGGAGGSVTTSFAGNVGNTVSIVAGVGGQGVTLGGKGGSVGSISLNSAQVVDLLSDGRIYLVAGSGGDATGSGGAGGAGGGVSGISQVKDINSIIALIQAGDGGSDATGTGGKGGSVSGVNTAGFIGQPVDFSTDSNLGVFDTTNLAQGVFSGRGGDGTTTGVAGSVSNITARQIAAISASFDVATSTFGIATNVSNIHADLIGYDANQNGMFDSEMGTTSPSSATPIDGFILAKIISQIHTLETPTQLMNFEFTS